MVVDPETGELTGIGTSAPSAPDFVRTLESLYIGGAPVVRLLTNILAECAMALGEAGGPKDKAKLTLTVELRSGKGEMNQHADYKIAYSHPTLHGRKAEDLSGGADVYVNRSGAVSLAPDTQGSFTFSG